MDRRTFLIRGIGATIIAGAAPIFLRSLIPEAIDLVPTPIMTSGSAVLYSTPKFSSVDSLDLYQCLKALYADDIAFQENILGSSSFFNLI